MRRSNDECVPEHDASPRCGRGQLRTNGGSVSRDSSERCDRARARDVVEEPPATGSGSSASAAVKEAETHRRDVEDRSGSNWGGDWGG